MTPGPLFSIITICRNEVGGIRGTCESIIGQAHQDFEWIVIDGASTDGTIEILNAYAHRITRLVSEPDDGIYQAMNKGVAMAKGAYLIFMNGGDRFADAQALARAAQAPRVELIYGDILWGGPEGPLVRSPGRLEPGILLSRHVPHQASFYQRDLFERFGTYDTGFRIAGDYDLYARLVEIGRVSHHHIAHPLAIFDLGGMSRDPAMRALRKRENHRVRMRYFPRYRRSPKAWRQMIRNLLHALIGGA